MGSPGWSALYNPVERRDRVQKLVLYQGSLPPILIDLRSIPFIEASSLESTVADDSVITASSVV
jgi:hypothetical protein